MSRRLSASLAVTNGPRPCSKEWIATADTSSVPVAAPRGPNRSAPHNRNGYGRNASGYCCRPYTNQVSKEISVPPNSPAPQPSASSIRQKVKRTEDGAPQVTSTGVMTKAASALGNHHSKVCGHNASQLILFA